MKHLSRAPENVHYLLNGKMEPRLQVKSGEIVKVECVRADANYLNKANPVFKDRTEVLELRSNPVTGPIFIEGAEPGDWLDVDILDIQLGDDGTEGYYTYVPGQGIFYNPFCAWDYPGQTEFCDVTKEQLELNFANKKVLTKNEPFIGTIATAPKEDVIAAYYSSKEWLGNVDCQQIRKGSSVVIPVNVKGALLSLGDLHAKQGAGEMLGCAIESAGIVTLRINVLKKENAGYIGWPQVNRTEFIGSLGFVHYSLEKAIQEAVYDLTQRVMEINKTQFMETFMFLSQLVEIELCQFTGSQSCTVLAKIDRQLAGATK
mgnify:CR=1 FL=1